jgi:hypothetical protein
VKDQGLSLSTAPKGDLVLNLLKKARIEAMSPISEEASGLSIKNVTISLAESHPDRKTLQEHGPLKHDDGPSWHLMSIQLGEASTTSPALPKTIPTPASQPINIIYRITAHSAQNRKGKLCITRMND